MKAVVCGTKFGRVYLSALARPDSPYELAGIVGTGSERTRRCAEYYGVPVYRNPDEVPADVSLACVVVGAGINGGPGAELAKQFLRRGVHVLQEHPLHEKELAECLREANQAGLAYRLNTLYPQVEPVMRFLETAELLRAKQQPLYVDAVCAFQVAYPLFDILVRALGKIRPWSFGTPAGRPPGLRGSPPYRSIDGVLGGVPLTLRLQHQMDPSEPDNFTHLFHRVTLGFDGGHLTLANTHGPVLWSPRAHMSADMADLVRYEDSAAGYHDFATARVLGPATAPDYRAVLGELWPAAVVRALRSIHDDIARGAVADRRHDQHHLGLCRLTKDVLDRFGPVELRRCAPPEVLSEPAAEAVPA